MYIANQLIYFFSLQNFLHIEAIFARNFNMHPYTQYHPWTEMTSSMMIHLSPRRKKKANCKYFATPHPGNVEFFFRTYYELNTDLMCAKPIYEGDEIFFLFLLFCQLELYCQHYAIMCVFGYFATSVGCNNNNNNNKGEREKVNVRCGIMWENMFIMCSLITDMGTIICVIDFIVSHTLITLYTCDTAKMREGERDYY